MVRSRWHFAALRRCVAVVSIVLAAATWGALARGAPLDLDGTDWEGLADFVQLARGELGDGRVVTASSIDFGTLGTGDGLILVHPERPLDVESCARFMHAGGRVVLLDDFGEGDGLLHHFRMARVAAPSRPKAYLRQNPQLALAEPAGPHPVVRDVRAVVTNHATGIRHPDLSPVLVVAAEDGPDVTIGVAGAVGKGRLLALGDGSLVMNQLLRYDGNKTLARGIVRYAVALDEAGSGKLYILSGAFDQRGSVGGDGALGDFGRSMRDAMRALRSEGMPPPLAHALAACLAAVCAVWLAMQSIRRHRPVVPRFAQRPPLAAQGGLAGHAAALSVRGAGSGPLVLEYGGALEEHLAARLELSGPRSRRELIEQAGSTGLLAAPELARLRALMAKLAEAETRILAARRAGKTAAFSDVELRDVARETAAIVAALGRPRSEAGAL